MAAANPFVLFSKGCYDEALQAILEVLTSSDGQGRLWELRGVIHAYRQEWHQACNAIETATTLVPLCGEARICLAESYRQTGLVNLAHDLAEGMIRDPQIAPRLKLALAALLNRVGLPQASITVVQDAIEAQPEWAQAWFDLAHYLTKYDPENGLIEHAARQAVRLEPQRLGFRLSLACRLVSSERFEEAYNLVNMLGTDELNNVCCDGCLSKLQWLYESVGDWERAHVCQEVREARSLQ